MPTAIEEKSDVAEQAKPGAGEAAEGSSDTAITEQLTRERSERTPSPDNDSTDVAGEHQDAGKEAEAVETEAPDTDKSRIKSRTAKRFGELTDELRDTKGKLSTAEAEKQRIAAEKAKLEEENRAFRARTLQQVEEPPAPAEAAEQRTDRIPTQAQTQPPGIEQLKSKALNLFSQYEQAKADGDAAKAAQLAADYHQTQTQIEQVRDQSLLRTLEHRQAQKAQAKKFMGELLDVHEKYPIFQRDEHGAFTTNLDYNSPMMKQAISIANQRGATKAEFLGNILFYLAKAELGMIQAERATDSATLTRARAHAGQLAEKAGLETGGRQTIQQDKTESLEGLSDEELNRRVSRQVRGK